MYATSNPILSIDVHYAFFQPLFNRRQPGSDSLGDVMGLATIRPIAEVSRELPGGRNADDLTSGRLLDLSDESEISIRMDSLNGS